MSGRNSLSRQASPLARHSEDANRGSLVITAGNSLVHRGRWRTVQWDAWPITLLVTDQPAQRSLSPNRRSSTERMPACVVEYEAGEDYGL